MMRNVMIRDRVVSSLARTVVYSVVQWCISVLILTCWTVTDVSRCEGEGGRVRER